MRVPAPKFIRSLDRYWLLNHPVFWMMRLHWMIYFGAIGLVLVCAAALTWPVGLKSILDRRTYLFASCILVVLALGPWAYTQARPIRQFRYHQRRLTAIYLLCGYYVVLGVYLLWPYSFVSILEYRIAARVSDAALEEDINLFNSVRLLGSRFSREDELEPALKLMSKYRPRDLEELDEAALREPSSQAFVSLLEETGWVISQLASVKDLPPTLENISYYAPKGDWKGLFGACAYGGFVLMNFLWVSRLADPSSFLVASGIFPIIGVCAILTDGFRVDFIYIVFLGSLCVIAMSGLFMSLFVRRLVRKNILWAVGLNLFALLVPLMPLTLALLLDIIFSLALSSQIYWGILWASAPFTVILSPWLERRQQILQAKPSS